MEYLSLSPFRVEDLKWSISYGDFFQTHGHIPARELGRGASSLVVLSKPENGLGDWEAVKMISKQNGLAGKRLFDKEVSFLKKIKHKHIIEMTMACEYPEMFVIAMPYCHHGTLLNHLPTMTTQMTDKWLIQLTSAVLYLHTSSMAHRNINPETILISKEGNAILSHFGQACNVKTEEMTVESGLGTSPYSAPELVEGCCSVNYFKCDMYSLGVVLWSMVVRDVAGPFQSAFLDRLPWQRQVQGSYRHLLNHLLASDQSERWTSEHLVRTLWFTWSNMGVDLWEYFEYRTKTSNRHQPAPDLLHLQTKS